MKKIGGAIGLWCLLALSVNAQSRGEDSLRVADAKIDTSVIVVPQQELKKLTVPPLVFKPNPKKAVLYSLIPGGGQIYNRKYWKLPLLYGGFLGLAYAITWNHTQYVDYLNAFRDISDNDDTTNSWQNYVRSSTTLTDSQISSYTTAFRNRKNYYRRYRDLSIIGIVGLYALSAVDAYVDASLFDFDISDDISMRVEPTTLPTPDNRLGSAWGVNCSIRF